MTRRPAPTRFARGVLLAVTSLSLTVAAHGAAGGELGDVVPALPLTLLIAFGCTALSERVRNPWTMLTALGVAQLGQHALLNLGFHPAHVPQFDPTAMTAAHVAAALLTGLLLARADTALSALVSAVRTLVPVLAPPRPATRPAAAPVVVTVVGTCVEVLLRRVNGRRGPPVLLSTRVP
ncbi:hypothetical protein [Actinosynnema sp. NPDC020468]|uniref:hypothetical protein n=1 Tax=Actinosynnema sp. NPDC020468 TaxID=3154488 RepID=UPI0033CD7189